MTKTERPGVYTSYEVSGSLYGGTQGAAVGLVAQGGSEEGGVAEICSMTQAREKFSGGNMTALCEILLKNGAYKIYAMQPGDGDYTAAFSELMKYGDIRFMVCDSRDAEIHKAMKETIIAGDEQGKYRIGIVESGEESREALCQAASEMGSERMVLVSHHEAEGTPGAVAAAVCGAAAAGEDPALPLNGAQLLGLGDIGDNFSDEDVSLLISGGVTPIETLYGSRSIIRGVTTRTKTAGTADPTWREVNTIMIIDHMMPAMRDSLRRRFARVKNTAQTRGAIRTQVLVELEDYKNREIIDSYGDINVSQSGEDPTICIVDFSFTVAHGLNKIELSAHITV